jgi:hypothetical protein
VLQKPIERAATLWGLVIALGCWFMMFAAGHDIWHALGKPDIWRQPGPTPTDIRAFVFSFYAMPVVLSALFVLTILRPGAHRPS